MTSSHPPHGMKVAFLGAGAWGFCLASLLAHNGHHVTLWTSNEKRCQQLQATRSHPSAPKVVAHKNIAFTTDIHQALAGCQLLCESVTSSGVRPVFQNVKEAGFLPRCPLVITSKGIEQNSGLLLSEVLQEIFGPEVRRYVTVLSGPSLALEVMQGLPTTVVCAGYDKATIDFCQNAFRSLKFRVYSSQDVLGVEFGGAMKNIIAIACGISDGLGFGDNTKAALMTRGLHEIRRLGMTKGCKFETLSGLSGMGDLCATCLSRLSRNYRFGHLLAMGRTSQEAKEEIGMVVEGAYTCLSAMQLAKKAGIELPIAHAVYRVLYENISPQECVHQLLERSLKDELL